MTGYRVGNLKSNKPEDVAEWARREFENVQASQGLTQFIKFKTWHAEPDKTFDGLTVLADGTDWNPGSGQGVYTYYGAAWHKLG